MAVASDHERNGPCTSARCLQEKIDLCLKLGRMNRQKIYTNWTIVVLLFIAAALGSVLLYLHPMVIAGAPLSWNPVLWGYVAAFWLLSIIAGIKNFVDQRRFSLFYEMRMRELRFPTREL